MTIQRADLFLQGIWDWGVLRGCFGNTKIEPTDIDGFVERKGRFLVLETKKSGVPVKTGQWWTFNSLVKTGYFTVIVVWGENGSPEEMQVLYPLPLLPSEKKKADLNDLRRVVAWWFQYAENQKALSA